MTLTGPALPLFFVVPLVAAALAVLVPGRALHRALLIGVPPASAAAVMPACASLFRSSP